MVQLQNWRTRSWTWHSCLGMDNFEDSILISEKVVQDDVLLQFEEFEVMSKTQN